MVLWVRLIETTNLVIQKNFNFTHRCWGVTRLDNERTINNHGHLNSTYDVTWGSSKPAVSLSLSQWQLDGQTEKVSRRSTLTAGARTHRLSLYSGRTRDEWKLIPLIARRKSPVGPNVHCSRVEKGFEKPWFLCVYDTSSPGETFKK